MCSPGRCAQASSMHTSGSCGFDDVGIWLRVCSSAISMRKTPPSPAAICEQRVFRSSSVASRISTNALKSDALAIDAHPIKSSIGHACFWLLPTLLSSRLANATTPPSKFALCPCCDNNWESLSGRAARRSDCATVPHASTASLKRDGIRPFP